MQAIPTTPLGGPTVTYELHVATALVSASTELFALGATIAGGMMSPALISEADTLSNRVQLALEVFRGAHARRRRPL
jgi:hypothetical protein